MRPLRCVFGALFFLSLPGLEAADADLAKALAISAVKLDEQGKPEKAKQLCLKALANDEECPEALYLMGVLLEKDGRLVQAGAFFSHAVQAFSKAAGGDPERAEKLKEARKSAQKTNPFGLQLQAAMEQYGKELAAIFEKSPDEVCAALSRKQVENLGLDRYLTPAQLAGLKKTSATLPTSPGTAPNPGLPVAANPDPAEKKVDAKLLPEVERALNKLGWKTLKGSWEKVAPNVFKVTDGALESPFTNGTIRVAVHGGKDAGQVAILVRKKAAGSYHISDSEFSEFPYSAMGYGFLVKEKNAASYVPADYGYSSSSDFYPRRDQVAPLPPAGKCVFQVSISENKLELWMNDKKIRSTTYRTEQSGAFSIEVTGTRILELPQVGGN